MDGFNIFAVVVDVEDDRIFPDWFNLVFGPKKTQGLLCVAKKKQTYAQAGF